MLRFQRMPSHRRQSLTGAALAIALGLVSVSYGQDKPDGQNIYKSNRCVTCHGADGQGTLGVALAGNANLSDTETVLDQIINGGNRMPAYGEQFSDAEIAAIATFVRTHFGNDFGKVTHSDVEKFRATMGPR